MKKKPKPFREKDQGYVLGERTFAAITAVEGIKLNSTSRKRLASFKKRKLSADEQRSEIVLAYTEPKAR